MQTKTLRFALFIVAGSTIHGCSFSHEAMHGSVVMTVRNEAHICLGSEDGIRVGELLTVYRTTEVPLTNEPMVPDRSGRYNPRSKFSLLKVGTARVTEVLSDHYAAIELVEGEMLPNDIVEKQRRP